MTTVLGPVLTVHAESVINPTSSAEVPARLAPEHSAVAAPTRRIRVAHLSLGLCTGGMERLLVEFARQHDPLRYELHFVALHQIGQPAEEVRAAGCQVHLLPDCRGKMWRQFRVLTKWLAEYQPDILHTHNAYPHFHGTLAARWQKVPVILNTRHGRRIGNDWKSRVYFRLAGLLADKVVAVSDDAANLCVQDSHLPANKVQRIWNGIDPQRFVHTGPQAGCRAISVARLSPEKDFPTLIRAVGLAREVVPELSLTIVGDGPDRPRMEATIRELNLQDHVHLLGERHDVPELLSQSSFFATSTLTEGISLTLLEAMAVGLPVIATAVGGNPEIVVEGQTGYLVSERNPEQLATAILRLCQAEGTWSELGRAGRQRVIEHFSINGMVRGYEALYEQLLLQKQ